MRRTRRAYSGVTRPRDDASISGAHAAGSQRSRSIPRSVHEHSQEPYRQESPRSESHGQGLYSAQTRSSVRGGTYGDRAYENTDRTADAASKEGYTEIIASIDEEDDKRS